MRSALAVRPDMDANFPLQREAVQYPRDHHVKSFHVVTSVPSSRPQHGVGEARMVSETNTRNLGNKVSCLALVRNDLNEALRAGIPQHKVTAKEIAPQIEASESTVENMRQNGVPDAMARLILLCRAYPDFGALVVGIIGLKDALEPHQEAVLLQLRQVMARGGK